MRDYFLWENGVATPVAKMQTHDIKEILADGCNPVGQASAEAIRERLELELFIRANGLLPADED